VNHLNPRNHINPANRANPVNRVNPVNPGNVLNLSSSGTPERAGTWCASGMMALFE